MGRANNRITSRSCYCSHSLLHCAGDLMLFAGSCKEGEPGLIFRDSFRWVVTRWVPPYKAHIRLV